LEELDLGGLELELKLELELILLELEISSSELLLEGSSCELEEEGGTYMLELMGIGARLELEMGVEDFTSQISLSLLELDSSWSAQKTSKKLSLPSLQPKTASAKAMVNKNMRII
jgi:hypothetical protein